MRKNVLFVTPSFSSGGAEKNILNIINSLTEDLFEVSLIVLSNEVNYLSFLERKIRIIQLKGGGFTNTLLKIRENIKIFKPDIIFSTLEHVSIQLCILRFSLRQRVILISRIPTLPSNNLGKSSGKFRLKSCIVSKLMFLLRISDIVICQTSEMQKEVRERYGIPYHKTIVIRNLVNNEQILKLAEQSNPFSKTDTINIVAMGGLYSAKGFDILIEAFAALVKERINGYSLYIIGDETSDQGYKRYLEKIVEINSLCGMVHFTGHLSNPFPYLGNADVFVLSSVKEGFPNVVLESLVLGTYVIVTNCVDFSGIVIEGVNGNIINKGDIKSLLKGLKEIEKRENVFQKTMENFDFNLWFQNLLK